MRAIVKTVPGWLAVAALGFACLGIDVVRRPRAIPAAPLDGPTLGCAPGSGVRTPPRWEPPDDATRTRIERGLRAYLEPVSEHSFRHRVELLVELKRLPDQGRSFLSDTDGLRSMLYRTRPFLPTFDRNALPEDAKDAEIAFDEISRVTSIVWNDFRLSFSLPVAYADVRSANRLNDVAPFPMIVSLHEAIDARDAGGPRPHPGASVLGRRWARREPLKEIRDAWVLLAPEAGEAGFLEGGRVRSEQIPLRAAWQRYPIDLDRIVIEGGGDALLVAACHPVFYAGVIVRDPAARLDPGLVRNLAGMPVYAVGTAAGLAEDLGAGGHPVGRFASGDVEGLPAWLATVRRCVPASFSWRCADETSQRLAHWVNLDVLDPGDLERTIRVEVVDTAADPNTIRLSAHGIRTVTLFLNDGIVDLDRPVRVVANGRTIQEVSFTGGTFATGKRVPMPARFDRTLDGMLDRAGRSIRKSLYFGWLFPVVLEGIQIPD